MYFTQRGAAMLAATERAGGDLALLTHSIANLQYAADLRPNDPLPLRYLAQAYQLDGRFDEAITLLERAASLHPDSLLVQTDLLRAYVAAGRQEHAWQLGMALGYTPDRFAVIGDTYRRSGDYAQALDWYEAAVVADATLRPRIVLNRLVSAGIAQDPQVWELLREAQIELSDLHLPRVGEAPVVAPGAWMRRIEALSEPISSSGTPLNHPYGGATGVFWWNGQAALLVEVTRAGAYVARVTVVNTQPPPIELAFGANGYPLRQVSLIAGDTTHSVVEFPVTLTTPLSTIDIWFLNDANINGLDRNAYIEQIEILPASVAR